MNKSKIAATVFAVVALGAAGTGTAFATSGHAAKHTVVKPATAVVSTGTSIPAHPVAQVAAPDTDNVQQGDQTTPDVATGSTAPDPVEAPTGSTPAAAKTVVNAPAASSDTSAGETTSETASETAAETATPESAASDGPGGHTDPAGNVDHQFNGNE
jgi:hypothetical protein